MQTTQNAPEYLSEAELLKVLSVAKQRGNREYCMFLLGYGHGLRASEIASLTILDVQNGMIHCNRGKESETTDEHLREHEARHLDGHLLLDLADAILDLEQILAPDVFHRDEVRAVDAAELEDLTDVRVRELARDLRFIDEHLDEVAILAHRRQDPLDRDDLLETLDAVGLRFEDLGHAAHADAIEQ